VRRAIAHGALHDRRKEHQGMARRFFFAGSLLLVVTAGCTQQGGSPSAPSAVPTVIDAASDGSTLKVTSPGPRSPAVGVRTDTLEPEFVIGPASALHASVSPAFEYRIEVQTMDGQPYVNSPKLTADGNGETRWKTSRALQLDTRYKWRARVELGSRFGPWSAFSEFLSLDYRGIVPRPANGVWPSTGPSVVAYIADSFPDYLHPTALTAQRIEHMEFLRDRIIEAGRCGGLDLARNLKRNIGPHSHDAIAWRKPNGFVEVIDIASAFDDKTIHLELHWQVVDGPSGYDPYPDHPGC
jgi:hypothetical protein